jgi:predicted helicase
MVIDFNNILEKYRKHSFSEHDKGYRFERLMQAYLLTDPQYTGKFKKVWMWNDFSGRDDLGGSDTGIDLVAQTFEGDFWAIQCKCYQAETYIDKPAVDSFISTSSRTFRNEEMKTTGFTHRLWISTSNKWGSNAEEAIRNQHPPVTRINLYDLQQAPIDWGKLDEGIHGEPARNAKKQLRPHQKEALDKVHEHFKSADRGKLIMACGTGKTFNSLRVAENETQGKGLILFMVPSIALLGQTLREWSADAQNPLNAICICSDPEVSRKKAKNEDNDNFSVVDLALPASTNTQEILRQFRHTRLHGSQGMTVVFSTYQSIEVIARVQKMENGFGEFDLIICDEAHRTTGVTLSGEDESGFTKVHDNDFIRAKKRLYMTATPRLYSDDSKSKAAQSDAILCSMDDTELYGDEIYRIGFGEAVEKDLLTDYKVLILTLNDSDVPPAVQEMIADDKKEINSDDASKLIGCINALSKQVLGDEGSIRASDPEPMRRAVAFCQNIAISKKITNTYNATAGTYINSLPEEKQSQIVSISSKHIDGTMSAPQRDELLGWLKATPRDGECRILTNVRCLSEGVDVPSLDAVLFLSARNSQVDVVQSVGRVMRKATGKKYGYIVIPVVIPSNVEANRALDDNERYRVVWTVLNALRAHDDRFNATVNKIELNRKRPHQIIVGRPDTSFDENGNPVKSTGSWKDATTKEVAEQLNIQFEQLQHLVFARMVQKVGDRRYWEQWAKSVADIAGRQIERIGDMIKSGDYKQAFEKFLSGLQKNINPSVTQREAIEMLSQHIITKPVFEVLFEGYSFVKHNPISVSMQNMLDLLEASAIEKDTETLQKFYESVKMRASGIDNAEGKQRIIIELYDKFFKTAFPKMVERLGIVYTPIEVVDFIVHSVNDVLQQEFGRTISDENVNILDPFTGTGTFITRLIQSGLIRKEDLERKYKNELYANEIVLLAYYIAAVNIENAYHDIIFDGYTPFDGICLTDTFQLFEDDDDYSELFPKNSELIIKQKNVPITVIMGNPPYSIGQKSANDNVQNQRYPKLDKRIAETYAIDSKASSVKALYDAYIKAFRWASDRLEKQQGGVVAFITNSGWIEKGGADGMRKCLEKEFSSIYVFNLRGAVKGKSGEAAKREGQNVFDIMTGVAITLLVKKAKEINSKAAIHYADIGEYLNRKAKFEILNQLRSIANPDFVMQELVPNEHGDWISQRNSVFESFIPLDANKKFDITTKSFFITHSLGIATAADYILYDYSKDKLSEKLKAMKEFYNSRLLIPDSTKHDSHFAKSKISWNDKLSQLFEKGKKLEICNDSNMIGMYRPFQKQYLHYDRNIIQRTYQQEKIFPMPSHANIVICVPTIGSRCDFLPIITNFIPDLHIAPDGAQCFPLYYYEENKNKQKTLFDGVTNDDYIRRDAVSNWILERGQKQYGKNVTKEDIFFYVYGFLHSPKYRETFAADLKKMLPRLPLVEDVRDFWAFSKAGRALAELHLNYENVPKHPQVIEIHEPLSITDALKQVNKEELEYIDYRVEQMRFPRKGQKDTIIYNSRITLENIPPEAYEYVVNGKPAIEWIMERYAVTTHKESGIKNDPNDWAVEQGKPRYLLDLLHSVINVSVQTVDIMKRLPEVKFDSSKNEGCQDEKI